jgi:hypothetical protein
MSNIKHFIVYKGNGQIEKTGVCLDIDFLDQNIDGCSIIEGQANQLTQYIEDGKIKNMPSKPSQNYIFNYETKQWQEDFSELITKIAIQRNTLLVKSDWTQLPNNPLTTEKQQEWAVYRQQLRDIPQQPGYPSDVVWPQQPE